MDWSTRKKIGCFGLMGFVVLLMGGYAVYKIFFSAAPTCFDGTRNQNEQGIDCGGICARVCSASAKTIIPVWSRVFHTAGDVYSMVAYVENQNVNAGVKKVSYEFRVYDDKNILAGEPVTGTTFIGPNDKTAIFASPVKTGNRIPKNVFFSFTSTPEFTVTDPKYQIPQLKTANATLSDVDSAPKLSADLVNDTLFDYRSIEIVAILYDAQGNALNASDTFVDAAYQQSSQKIYFTWPAPFDRPVARIELIPRLNPFIQVH